MKTQTKTQSHKQQLSLLTEGAVMVALATVLSFLRIVRFPWGGGITVLSMLPIVVFALRHGAKKGMLVSFSYALIQLGQAILFDGLFGWGLTPAALMGCIFLDYIGAFGVLCLAGIFGNQKGFSIMAGTVLALVLRFSLHYVSGVWIFHSFGELWAGFSTQNSWLYSFVYNGAYMLPETVFTVGGAMILFKTPQIRKYLLKEK